MQRAVLAVVLAAFGLLAPSAGAATFTVTNTNDAGAGSLRRAIEDASANGANDTIAIDATGTITLASGLPVLDDGMQGAAYTITGPGSGKLAIDGVDQYELLSVGFGNSLTLSGLTLTNGASGDGGALFVDGVRTALTDVVVSSSTASGRGGGIFSRGDLTLTDVTVTGNRASTGGGISQETTNRAGRTETFTLTATRTRILGNSATDNAGGLQVAGERGFESPRQYATATISESTIAGNTATAAGGGIFVGDFATLNASYSTLSGNTSGTAGGGIGTPAPMIERWEAARTAAVEPGNAGTPSLNLDTMTVSDNVATASGGGVSNLGQAEITDTTLASNAAPVGANYAQGAGATGAFMSTLIAYPLGGGGNCSAVTGAPITSRGFNLDSSDPGTCGFGQATDQNGVDPQLRPLTDNGGVTQTRALPQISPAVDRGGKAPVEPPPAFAALAVGANTDQRGSVRPFDVPGIPSATGGDGRDVGAFELAPPVAVTGTATDVTTSAATVAGTGTNPAIRVGLTYFEYGLEANKAANRTANLPLASGANGSSRTAGLTGLQPATTYFFRIVADNGEATSVGEFARFTTPAAPPGPQPQPDPVLPGPDAVTDPATRVTTNAATLNGDVEPNGIPTSYRFEYGLTTSYGSTTSSRTVAVAEATRTARAAAFTEVARRVRGLAPGTTYHFRIVAVNERGTAVGRDRRFTTPEVLGSDPPPRAATGGASRITIRSATIAGTVDPRGSTTRYRFLYGLTHRYGSRTAQRDAGDADRSRPVSASLDGLRPATTYHYRVVAESRTGRVVGRDRTFTTPAPPLAVTAGATEIRRTAARILGRVRTRGADTRYVFRFGRTTAYGNRTRARSIPAPAGRRVVSAALDGLKPGTLYHYRVIARNPWGTSVGRDRIFRTPAPTPQFTG